MYSIDIVRIRSFLKLTLWRYKRRWHLIYVFGLFIFNKNSQNMAREPNVFNNADSIKSLFTKQTETRLTIPFNQFAF